MPLKRSSFCITHRFANFYGAPCPECTALKQSYSDLDAEAGKKNDGMIDRYHSFGLELDMPLDEGIATAVHLLREQGIETIESCQGGEGHPFPEPTIRLAGGPGEGFRAYGIAVRAGLQPRAVSRIWIVDDGELTGPYWDLIFK